MTAMGRGLPVGDHRRRGGFRSFAGRVRTYGGGRGPALALDHAISASRARALRTLSHFARDYERAFGERAALLDFTPRQSLRRLIGRAWFSAEGHFSQRALQ